MEFYEKKMLITSFIEPHDAICTCKFCKQLQAPQSKTEGYEIDKIKNLLPTN